jgi:MFS family permease
LSASLQNERNGFAAPLAGTFAVQTMVSLAMFGVPVIAPVAAPDIGVKAELIGTFTAIAYLAGTVAGLMTGAVAARVGAIRVCQLAMLLVLAGTMALSLSYPVAAIASAVLLGLSYGPINPVSTQILASVTTPRTRPLIFSIKQTGMPVGAALAGLLLPLMIGLFDWKMAFVSIGLAAILVAVVIQPLRPGLDAHCTSGQPIRMTRIVEPLRLGLASPQMRSLLTIGLVYGGSQVAIASFFVIQLTGPIGLRLETAGLMYTLMQLSAVAGRLLWGGIAGWMIAGNHVLVGLGLATSMIAIAAGFLQPSTPLWLVAVVSILLGMTSHGFNGVMFAELTRHVPEARISTAAGGLQFASLVGVAIFPLIFGLLVSLHGDYLVAYTIIAMAVLAAATFAACRLGTDPA